MLSERMKHGWCAAIAACWVIAAALPAAAQAQEPPASQHAFLGADLRDLTRQEAATLGLKLPHGTAVKKVEANSPAAAAGLKRGDIVVEINGKSVADTGQFLKVIASKTPGTVVTVRLLRDGRLRAGPVKLGVKPAEALAASMPHPEKAPEPVRPQQEAPNRRTISQPSMRKPRTSPRREIYRSCCACGALRLPGPAAAWRGTQGVRGGHRLAGVSIQRTRPLRRSRTVAEAGAGDARAPVGQGASGYADQRQ